MTTKEEDDKCHDTCQFCGRCYCAHQRGYWTNECGVTVEHRCDRFTSRESIERGSENEERKAMETKKKADCQYCGRCHSTHYEGSYWLDEHGNTHNIGCAGFKHKEMERRSELTHKTLFENYTLRVYINGSGSVFLEAKQSRATVRAEVRQGGTEIIMTASKGNLNPWSINHVPAVRVIR